VAPLEPWEKVLISDAPAYLDSVHGHIVCTECHGGAQSPDKETAHEGLVANPSQDFEKTCGECHPDVVSIQPSNLHVTQAGYWTVLDQRSTPESHSALENMFDNHCASCHTTCGDCHVSQPGTVGGGFIDGHVFQKTPSMTRNCTACHGSRVGNEYLGKNEGLRADVHFREGRMNCVNCHDGSEMHGDPGDCMTCHPGGEEAIALPPADHRYAGVQSPRCETCHASAATGQDGTPMHVVHGGDLSCQVCHSVSYSNCDGCHVAVSEKTGNPFFSTDATYLGLFIGRNPRPSYERPYAFVLLRHVPIAPDNFDYYGEDLLANFNRLPTWVYTTPHNVQLDTPQAESCNACHGNAEWFLTADRVKPAELRANQSVIVGSVPAPVPLEEETAP